MSLTLYDNAFLKKLQYWANNTQTTIVGVNESTRLFSTIADTTNDKPIQLPLIALSRPGGFIIDDKYKQPRSFDSATFVVNSERNAKLNAIRIDIPYQIDIYARYKEEADEYIRNIVFNIINYPNISIEIPYEDLGLVHHSSIRINSDVDDNSDIPERLISGQFTRYTLGIIMDDAYLFDVRIGDNLSIASVDVIA